MRKEEKDLTRNQAVGITLVSSIMFATSYVAIKMGLEDVDPFLFEIIMLAMGAAIAVLYTLLKGSFTLKIFRRWEVWAAMAIGPISFSFQFVGMTMTTASKGALIIGATVVFVAPLSAIIFKEKIGRRKISGMAIGMIGLITLTTGWSISELYQGEFLGDLLLLGSAALGACVWTLTRIAMRTIRYDQWMMALYVSYLVPLFFFWLLFGGPSELTSDSLIPVLYVGIVCTSIPGILWALALTKISLTTSATIILSESVFGTFLGWLILREELGLLGVIGAVLIFVAIYVVARGENSSQNGDGGKKSKGEK